MDVYLNKLQVFKNNVIGSICEESGEIDGKTLKNLCLKKCENWKIVWRKIILKNQNILFEDVLIRNGKYIFIPRINWNKFDCHEQVKRRKCSSIYLSYEYLKEIREKQLGNFVLFPYSFQIEENLWNLTVYHKQIDLTNSNYLKENILLKLNKIHVAQSNENKVEKENELLHFPTHQLIDLLEYLKWQKYLRDQFYQELKKNWTEKTDPIKYITEDINIASYILCLLKENLEHHIIYDLGCGNGLVDGFLSGHVKRVRGIDVQRRKIWSTLTEMFSKIELEIGTIEANSTFEDGTFLIGNHCDELTPWIPLFACRSLMKSRNDQIRFLIIPCCFWGWNGKYEKQRKIMGNGNHSLYHSYIRYIQDICLKCGIRTFIDKLRIPSTKNFCLYGIVKRSEMQIDYVENIFSKYHSMMPMRNIKELSKCRNATQIDADLKEKLMREIVKQLQNCEKKKMISIEWFVDRLEFGRELNEKTIILPTISPQNISIYLKEINCEIKEWNIGGQLKIGEIIKKIDRELLKDTLKNENGGLLTFFKNNSNIFTIEKEGFISLTMPRSISFIEWQNEKKKKDIEIKELGRKKRKTKRCFHDSNEWKCIWSAQLCDYVHSDEK
ncbi:hypothetical protein SNEBB_000923 [Seison nebaliae]|nr:hypothetical protein SNEBB_000923 [Seison nebaliae]